MRNIPTTGTAGRIAVRQSWYTSVPAHSPRLVVARTIVRSVRSDSAIWRAVNRTSESDTATLIRSTAITEFAAVASAAAPQTPGSVMDDESLGGGEAQRPEWHMHRRDQRMRRAPPETSRTTATAAIINALRPQIAS